MSAASQAETTDELLTIDELALAVGLTVRTTRYYAGLGLIPPPERRGRVGYYGPCHRARLELIRELQGHGYALTAIERHLKRLGDDATLEEITAQRILLAPWVPDAGEEMEHRALQQRVGRRLTPELVEALTRIGAIEQAGPGRFRVTPTLDVVVRLLDLALPLESVVEAGEAIDRATSGLADELNRILRHQVVQPYREQHQGATGEDLARTVERLRPLTIQAIVTGFQRAANRIIRQTLDDRG